MIKCTKCSAMEFNGINSYIKLPNDVVSTQNIRDKGITYTAWIKMLNNNLEQNIVGQKPHIVDIQIFLQGVWLSIVEVIKQP